MSCRRPHCKFDILVVRYEALNASLGAVFDFLRVPLAARAHFPPIRGVHPRQGRAADVARSKLRGIYGALERAIDMVPPEGLLLRNAYPYDYNNTT